MTEDTKWVACWGTATSVCECREASYSKDLTLRYPIRICFSGSRLRFHFSNLTGTEPVTITRATVALEQVGEFHPVDITLSGDTQIRIAPGEEVLSDEIPYNVSAGQTILVSLYLGDFTQMRAGTLVTGPLSGGEYAYGDFSHARTLERNLTNTTNWYYFLNTVDIFTQEDNHALVCYGDSITAQSWPDYLALRAWREGYHHVAIIRRAVCGTRILRQYNCIRYLSYGLKGETRFPIEINTAGVSAVIIQHGINDIIHPVGVEVNKFRPWSDMPTVEQLKEGVKHLYVDYIREHNLPIRIYSGTLLPIKGWRTYNEMRDSMRREFNEWLRTSPIFDGYIDFDLAVRDHEHPRQFAPGFDSGDHLHPSEKAYTKMADTVPSELLK